MHAGCQIPEKAHGAIYLCTLKLRESPTLIRCRLPFVDAQQRSCTDGTTPVIHYSLRFSARSGCIAVHEKQRCRSLLSTQTHRKLYLNPRTVSSRYDNTNTEPTLLTFSADKNRYKVRRWLWD